MSQALAARALGLIVVAGLMITFDCCNASAAKSAPTTSADTKLESDSTTRATMEHIRQRVIDVHTLITHRRMPVESAKHFAKDVIDDVSRIEAHRAAGVRIKDPIVPILHQIKQGATAIAEPKSDRSQIDGLFDVVAGLEAYGAAFDHPGWRRLQDR